MSPTNRSIYEFSEFVLRAYCVQVTILDIGDTPANKTTTESLQAGEGGSEMLGVHGTLDGR